MAEGVPAGEAVAPPSSGGQPVGLLSYRQARQAPCLDCAKSPCCTHLLLSDFQLDTVLDVDHALFLLNFEGIMLGLGSDRRIDVYLHQPCGLLDVASGLCTVHKTPAQPAVCVSYKSHSCGYRKRMGPGVDPNRPVVDRERMKWLAERLVFDDDRQLVGLPDWEEIIAGFTSLDMRTAAAARPGPDPVVEEWRSIVLSTKPAPERQVHRHSDAEVSAPCEGCGAWCCQMLVFNRGMPVNASQLDFLRYCLGFPSVELGVSPDSWAVIVHTTCRHLDGGRCSVYGTDERPLRCGYYDALSCSYRAHFGVPQAEGIVRVRRDQFPVVAESLAFDDLGTIVAMPSVDVLRNLLEDAERAAAR